ncbi:MAG: class I SAM-dependent methyltransferase [Fermentimonas sp.]|nr:class I SAM-dependent methyltransferase [Fermentimonas sp.]
MKSENKITDQAHWEEYWNNFQYDKIPDKVVFKKFMPQLTMGKSFIEIGGFPGQISAYFYNHGIHDVALLDFHLNKDIVRNLERINNLPQNSIKCIHTDFFNFKSDRKYDIVFSSGFIEHFEDTADVISRHVDLLSENGQLLILIPNFLGLNGVVQRKCDRPNLEAHNLKSMEIPYLENIMDRFNLRDLTVEYIGRPMLWLEPKPENKNKRKWIKMLSYVVKLFPFKSKFLSPFIAIYARK